MNQLEDLINKQIPFGINKYIYLEILQGVSNEAHFNKLKLYLNDIKFYDLKNGLKSYEEASRIYYKCRKSGRTIRSTIDILIAQTVIENNLLLLHNNKDFQFISEVVPELVLL